MRRATSGALVALVVATAPVFVTEGTSARSYVQLRTPELRRPYEAGELVRLPTRAHVVALTFDGGADAGGAERVLATLLARRVPATFFVTGDWVRRYPALARAIGRNFAVGDHTVHHSPLPGLSRSWWYGCMLASSQPRPVAPERGPPPHAARPARPVGRGGLAFGGEATPMPRSCRCGSR